MMGWYYGYEKDKQAFIQGLVTPDYNFAPTTKCLRHQVVGTVLWSVWEFEHEGNLKREISCHLLNTDEAGRWGYKPMSESWGPGYYSCPLAYLKMVPVACQAWRDRVLAYHSKNEHIKQFKAGDKIALTNCSVAGGTLLYKVRRSWIFSCSDTGRNIRLSPKHFERAKLLSEAAQAHDSGQIALALSA